MDASRAGRGTILRSLIAVVATVAIYPCLADPFQAFNKPVSIGWWKASCKDAYVTNPARGYAKGYCHGVMLAYMNGMPDWCVPDGVSWGEVQDYVALSVVDANIDPFSTMPISDWIESAMSVKWPCEDTVDDRVVTDPQLVERLDEVSRSANEETDD